LAPEVIDAEDEFQILPGKPEISSPSRFACGTIAAAMTPDIVANAIVAAIATGAVGGDTDAAKVTIADAYEELKSLVKKKFGHDSDVAEVIACWKPSPIQLPGRYCSLKLNAVNSKSDPELVSAAQSVLGLIKALPQGENISRSCREPASLRLTGAAPIRLRCRFPRRDD
jgi:hypothetical protein